MTTSFAAPENLKFSLLMQFYTQIFKISAFRPIIPAAMDTVRNQNSDCDGATWWDWGYSQNLSGSSGE